MGISLSGGPWQYNRFNLAEASKPDYLDFDKDGDKKEPMKKALKEKGGKKCPKCGKSPCECGKSDMKEWVEEMVQEGIDLGEYTWDDMVEIFNEGKGMHREADTGKVVDKAEVGKTYYPNMPKKKTSVKKKPDAFGGRFKKEETINEALPLAGAAIGKLAAGGAAKATAGMAAKGGLKKLASSAITNAAGNAAEAAVNKATSPKKVEESVQVTKEDVCGYLMNEGFANNPVSAEIMFNHMSEEWLEAIKESGNQ